uniref:uncharacterized protein susd5 n=1 Tax=Centroberyx gerrardi TaxID=166262 RepID=UPI003AB02A00
MLERYNQNVLSSLFGCVACLALVSVVNADGRVFLMDLRNSSDLQGFRDAERACATQQARLASADELRDAVVECSFSACTRGWLYGGTVGTTVCNIVGSVLKAVDVRTENATEETAHLDAFCVKDKGVPCGDPPSFPNTRLQGHTGFEMGDELLYTCVPGYVMPSGHSAFSLLCDSCGEWYGLVQICVKDETETHVDYEDKFTDAYGEPEEERAEEAQGEVYEEVHGAAHPEDKRSQQQQEASFSVEAGEEHQDQQGEEEVGGEEEEDEQGSKLEGIVKGGEEEEERAVEDSTGHPGWEQERQEGARTDAAVATEAPVSLLSQKHLFWFPSEAFQEAGHPVPTHPVIQTTPPEGENRLRASGAQSEESKEYDSQEGHYQHPADLDDPDDHEQDSYNDRDDHHDDGDDHDDSHHDDQDVYNDSHHDDQDNHDNHDDSHHEDQDDHDDHVKHYIPAQHDDLDKHGRYDDPDDHDDHYDMGEHEDERDRVRYGSQGEYNEQDKSYDEDHDHESYDDHDDVTEDHDDQDEEHPDGSEEHPDHHDHDDGKEHYDLGGDEDDSDSYTDHDRYDDHDHDDHEHDDHDSYDSHDDHDGHDDNDDDDGHQHVVFPMATDERQNFTQEGAAGKPTATTDETWLDGYPVVPEETEKGGSTEEEVGPEEQERETVVGATDRPNEVEVSRPIPYTSLPEAPESGTVEPDSEQGGVEEVWPGLFPTATPSPASPEPSDTQDYDTQHVEDPTEHPFLDHGPAPPMHDDDDSITRTGARPEHDLTGQTGERGEVEGEMGETICTGEDCPPRPPTSSSRGPTVAAIIVAVCAVVTAVVVGAWCYRRRQQKSSMYEMNGKGQSQSRHGQQIEMQQKV